MKYFCLFALLFASRIFLAQTETPKYKNPVLVTFAIQRTDAKVESKYLSNYILTKVQKMVGARHESSFTTLYKVTPSFGVQEVRVIETFEKKYYADLDIYLRLRGSGFFKDSLLYKYSASASGEDEKTAVQKAMNVIFADKKFNGFVAMLDSLFESRYNTNGVRTLQQLNAMPLTTMKELDEMLIELMYFQDYPDMKSKVDVVRNKILDKRSDIFCKSELPGLKIKVASTMYNADEVVKKLLLVSPTSDCSSEVLEMAKTIGTQLQAKNVSKAPDPLILLIEVHRDRNADLWRSRYY